MDKLLPDYAWRHNAHLSGRDTRPYANDVPIKGPKTRYKLEGGGYETHPDNPGVRHFVWEHLNNVNRILH